MTGDGGRRNRVGECTEELHEKGGGSVNGGEVRWLERTVWRLGGDIVEIGREGVHEFVLGNGIHLASVVGDFLGRGLTGVKFDGPGR